MKIPDKRSGSGLCFALSRTFAAGLFVRFPLLEQYFCVAGIENAGLAHGNKIIVRHNNMVDKTNLHRIQRYRNTAGSLNIRIRRQSQQSGMLIANHRAE